VAQQIKELVVVTDALFLVEQAKMQQIASEEAAIVKLLAELESRCAKASEGGQEDMIVARTLGADLLWQIWVGKKRAALQMELAKVMVRKAQALESLRKAFGRSQVADQLGKQEAVHLLQKKQSNNLRIEQDRLAMSGTQPAQQRK